MSDFKEFWKIQNQDDESFEKSALTNWQLTKVAEIIRKLQNRGLPAYRIIKRLQTFKALKAKLNPQYRAAAAYWTQVKKDDTHLVANASKDLGVEKYRVILSPNACPICREKTEQGQKVFKSEDVEKSGFGHVPPFHPNCYCILVPKIDL